jgi:hypothetical protein
MRVDHVSVFNDGGIADQGGRHVWDYEQVVTVK